MKKLIVYLLNLDLNHYKNLKTGGWHLAIVKYPIHFNCRSVFVPLNEPIA